MAGDLAQLLVRQALHLCQESRPPSLPPVLLPNVEHRAGDQHGDHQQADQ